MPGKGAQALAALRIPYEQLSTLAAIATRSQSRSIGTPGQARDHAVMSGQLPEQRPVGSVPHVHRPIIAPASYERPIRVPGHVPDPGRELTPSPQLGVRPHIPHEYPAAVGSAGQPLSVRAPRQTVEVVARIVRMPHDLTASSRSRVP